MDASELPRAVAACRAVAAACDLRVDDAVVLNDSNRLVVHLQPCDVLARVAPRARQNGAEVEVEVARRLAETGAPLATLDPRVEPRVYEQDDFAVTLWTYYEPVPPHHIAPDAYASALERLHAGMRQAELTDDLETCCRGPVEFDIAHATIAANGPPIEVCALYAGADQSLVRECWILMLAMVTAWRCEPGDDLPNGRAMAIDWIRQLRTALDS